MLKALIVDDEKYIRDELKYFLEKTGEVDIVGETGEGEEVMDFVNRLKPDVVFLDVHLQDVSGLLLARKILDTPDAPFVVLATAYEKYAIQGFEINVADYMLKPFSEERLKVTIERIKKLGNKTKKEQESEGKEELHVNKLCVIKNNRLILVNIEDIQYVESVNNELMVYTENGEYRTNYSLKELEEKFHHTNLIRTHKSYIVNIDYIDEIIPWFNYTYKVKIKGRETIEIPVSRYYLKRFKNLLGI